MTTILRRNLTLGWDDDDSNREINGNAAVAVVELLLHGHDLLDVTGVCAQRIDVPGGHGLLGLQLLGSASPDTGSSSAPVVDCREYCQIVFALTQQAHTSRETSQLQSPKVLANEFDRYVDAVERVSEL